MAMTTKFKPSKDAEKEQLHREPQWEGLDLGTHRTDRLKEPFFTGLTLHYPQDLRKFLLKAAVMSLLKRPWSRAAQMPARSWPKIGKKRTAVEWALACGPGQVSWLKWHMTTRADPSNV